MNYLGATFIAGLIYFTLGFLSNLWLEGPQVTTLSAFLEAAIKTAVFVLLFHYAHNFVAGKLGWYGRKPDDAAIPQGEE
ncbi:MAG: hypothetical protein ACPGID_06145 [Rubricella sp.]